MITVIAVSAGSQSVSDNQLLLSRTFIKPSITFDKLVNAVITYLVTKGPTLVIPIAVLRCIRVRKSGRNPLCTVCGENRLNATGQMRMRRKHERNNSNFVSHEKSYIAPRFFQVIYL